MSPALRRTLVTAALAFLAALAGVAIGARVMHLSMRHNTELHSLIHRNITLDSQQEIALDRLEARFAITRAALEAQMRADNARLAAAIEQEHGNGPQVLAAIDRSHHSMGELQKATLAHVFAMRRLLRPDQAATFDRQVIGALTADPG